MIVVTKNGVYSVPGISDRLLGYYPGNQVHFIVVIIIQAYYQSPLVVTFHRFPLQMNQ